MNFNKGIGRDLFDGNWLKEPEIKRKFINFAMNAFYKNQVPDYLTIYKLVLFSKAGNNEASFDNTRPIAIDSHVTKIRKKAVKLKLMRLNSTLLSTEE